MKTPHSKDGFTLLELLVVIAIIGILASMIVTGIGIANTKSKISLTRLQMADFKNAISDYERTYGNLPLSQAVLTGGAPDFTYGAPNILNGGGYETDNRELVAVLMNLTHFRDGTPTVNVDRSLNPNQTPFLSAKQADSAGSPGIGSDGVYRDLWGNPYIVSVDLDFTDHCLDAMYRRENVSRQNGPNGYKTLFRPNGQSGDRFGLQTSVMIWSFGPDRTADPNLRADQNDSNSMMGNADNVLGWVD